jgi:hypothetical protein
MARYFFLFSLLFLIAGAAIWETALRLMPKADETRLMECLRLGGQEHHYFLRNCETTVETPTGSVSYSLNEDGFRADSRSFYASGAVALLGDSKVEGWWLNREETVGAQLRQRGALGGLPDLNLGIRFSGPTIQRLRLERALEEYPLRAVIWFLNGTDSADERLAHSLAIRKDEFGAPLELSLDDAVPPFWLEKLQAMTGNRSALLRWLQMKLYDREVIRRVLSTPPEAEVVCSSLHSGFRTLQERGIPVLAVLLPLGPNIDRYPYMNFVSQEDPSDQILGCLTAAAVPIVDLRGRLDMSPSLYWSIHRNMTPEGVRHLADVLAPELSDKLMKLLGQTPSGP